MLRDGEEVDFALLVFAEGEHREVVVGDGAIGDDALGLGVVLEGPESAGDVVGVEVVALQFRKSFAAIDEAAGDRLADVVVVFPDRLDEVVSRADAVGPKGCRPSRSFQP